MKKDNLNRLLILFFVLGLGLIAYPSVSNWWNELKQTRAILDYESSISRMSDEEYQQILTNAHAYNETLSSKGIQWVQTDPDLQSYFETLNIDGKGNMGYISIPKISVNLPIFHGISEEVLQNAIGHVPGTSLPIGGQTSHSVISGHRGLPSSRLFSDLDQLQIGDRWTISVMNETFTYEVDQILTVEPDDIQHIQMIEGQDLMTLITCTPYGVNTHRLLIRGHRISNVDGNALVIAEAIQIKAIYIAPFIATPLLLILIATFMRNTSKKEKYRKLENNLISQSKGGVTREK